VFYFFHGLFYITYFLTTPALRATPPRRGISGVLLFSWAILHYLYTIYTMPGRVVDYTT